MYAVPLIHDHPHHDTLLACRCFKGKLLLSSSALDVFMENLDRYTDDDLDCVKYFPAQMKNLIARKFFSTRAYINHKEVNLKKIISVILHDKLIEAPLTLYSVDDDIMKSLKACKNLQNLHIDGRLNAVVTSMGIETSYPSLTPEAIVETASYLPELRDLRIEYSDAVTDEVVIAIAENCKKLQRLNLRDARILTDVGFKALVELQELVALDISGSQITDIGMYAMLDSTFIEKIEDIRLDNCKHIKDFNFGLFASKCKALTMFSCQGCAGQDQMHNLDLHHLKNLKQLNWAVEW